MRYLGVFIIKSRVIKCDLDQAKRSFYRAVNAIFGRIGRIASEEVIIQLINSKCIPIGVNPAGDAGDVSSPIFWLVGTSMGMSPPIFGVAM